MAGAKQRKGTSARRYPREVIISAIEKVNDGATMASVAAEIGTRSNVVKYWIDHADNYLGPQGKRALMPENGLTAYTSQRFHREGWGVVSAALREARRKLKGSSMEQITHFVEMLVEKLGRYGRLDLRTNRGIGVPPIVEEQKKAIKEIEIMIARFSQKKMDESAPASQRECPPVAEPAGRSGPEAADEPAADSVEDSRNE
ncbi:MAG: hypothetical protein WC728_03870 [Elusimicrobiota bacterium]